MTIFPAQDRRDCEELCRRRRYAIPVVISSSGTTTSTVCTVLAAKFPHCSSVPSQHHQASLGCLPFMLPLALPYPSCWTRSVIGPRHQKSKGQSQLRFPSDKQWPGPFPAARVQATVDHTEGPARLPVGWFTGPYPRKCCCTLQDKYSTV